MSGESPAAILYDEDGNAVGVTQDGSVYRLQTQTKFKGVVSSGNSSTALLGSGATFTGTFEDVLDYSMVTVSVFADQVSGSNGLSFQWSHDGVNVDRTESSSLLASVGRAFALTVRARHFRIVYLNGTSAQGAFRLGTVLHHVGTGIITRPISGTLTSDNFAILTRSVLSGQRPTLDYGDCKVDSVDRLIVTTPSASAAIAGFSDGKIVLATATVTPVYFTAYTEQTSNAQRSLVSSSASDASAGTGARTVRITYYALSGVTVTGPFTENVTMNGTTAVDTVATDICFIEEMEVLTVGSGLVNAGTISLKAAVSGGGATVWSIAVGDNHTFGAHHYIASGKTAFVTGLVGGIKGADTASFFIRRKDPADANSAEVQLSDLIRVPSSGQANRAYATPLSCVGPCHIRAFAAPDSTSNRTYYVSFDYYEGDT